MAYESIHPFNGKSVKKFDELTDERLEAKIAEASGCYETWKKNPYANRAVIVPKAAELMHAHVDRFARYSTIETGKLINEFHAEVKFIADTCLLCQERRAVSCTGKASSGQRRGAHREQPHRCDVRGGTVELTRVEKGMMFIDNIDWSDAELPFGGIKDSGCGRELVNMGIQEFVNKKLVRTHDAAAPLV